jgi:hypothetical protein
MSRLFISFILISFANEKYISINGIDFIRSQLQIKGGMPYTIKNQNGIFNLINIYS